MKKIYPYLIFFAFTVIFFYKCFFFGEVIFPATQFYQMKPFNETKLGKEMFEKCNYESGVDNSRWFNWNALQFDNVLEFYPWRHYLGECYKKGKLPVNNEYSFSGKSFFMANGQSGVFYPLNILYVVFSTPVAFTIFVILHVLLLQIFMYIYLKRLKLCDIAAIFGTVAFGFCSFVINWLMLPTFVAAITWLPLVAYSIFGFFETYKPKFALLGGVFLALSFLGGHLQIAFYVSIFALFYFIYLIIINYKNIEFKQLFFCALLFIIVFGVIASVQIVPTLKASELSHRHTIASRENYEWQTKNGIHKFYLSNILNLSSVSLSGVFDESKKHFFSNSDKIEFGLYCGFVTVFFALISILFIRKKDIIFYLVITLFFYYMACGGIVYKLIYYIPGVSSFGSPCRSICIGLFAMSILGALGLNEYLKFVKDKPKIKIGSINYYSKFLISLFGFICIFILGRIFIAFTVNSKILLTDSSMQYYMETMYARIPISIGINILFGMILLIIILLIISLFKNRKANVLLILLLFGQLFFSGFLFNETCKPEFVYPKCELTDKLKELGGTVAVINDKWSMTNNPQVLLPPNMLMYYGIKEVGGYDSLMLNSYKKELESIAGENLSPVENGNMIMIKKPFKGLEKYADYMVSSENYEQYKKIGVYNKVNVYKLK